MEGRTGAVPEDISASTPARAEAAATPSNPGASGYALTWEPPADQRLPPPGWASEFITNHSTGQPQVRIVVAPEPVRAGTRSARFRLDRGDDWVPGTCGVRCELAARPAEPAKADRWYGFSIFLPRSFVPDESREILAQWHQVTEGGSPPLALLTRRGQWWVSLRDWTRPNENETLDKLAGPCALGAWTDWIVHAKWRSDATGLLEVWKNGSSVRTVPRSGRNTFANTTRHYIKIGIYKWQWNIHAPSPPPPGCSRQPDPGTVTSRVVYYDEIRVADGTTCGSIAACKKAVAPRGPRPPPVP